MIYGRRQSSLSTLAESKREARLCRAGSLALREGSIMKHKRIALFLALTVVSLGIAFSRARNADSQVRQPGRDRAILIGMSQVEGALRTKAGESSMKGRTSFYLETGGSGEVIVKQFNLVFPAAPQAAITGRQPKSKDPNGVLGMSIPA